MSTARQALGETPSSATSRIRFGCDALIAADGDVTESHVTAVIGKGGWDAAAGAAAAREFLAV
ncbi:hypothetical protein [Streptomyces sp. NBC_00286]|uniref:hypothetical protein n=1 Tax=Streptomyces sp. NBC_00286 TaxID=2975701 RepID=UPI002E2E1075|nr:hypothetical protein [Streptomyces sp. NBC_00286]